MRRLLPPHLTITLALAMGLARAFGPTDRLLPDPWSWLGAGFIAAGVALAVGGSRQFERSGTNIKTFDDPDVLVSHGLFARSRNPMYLGFAVLLVGLGVIVNRPWALLGPVVFVLAADRWYIPFEEARMRATFGPSFDRYRAEVRRWL